MALGDPYATLAEYKARSGVDDTVDDIQITAVLDTVSRWIEEDCGRQFNTGTTTRTYSPCNRWRLDVDDLVSVTTLKTDADGDGVYETTWAAGEYQLVPTEAMLGQTWPYTQIRALTRDFPVPTFRSRSDRVEIVGVFGWTAVPAPVKRACLIMATDLLKLDGMAFGVAGYGEYGAVRARPNPIVAAMLAPYRLNPIKVG